MKPSLLILIILYYVGLSFEQKYNACTIGNNPCVKEAECYVETYLVGAPKCRCMEGLQGDGLVGGTGCSDIDECAMNIDTCDRSTQICTNIYGSYECTCKQGLRWHETKKNVCVDIDECVELNVCPSSTLCINLEGSFKCECLDRSLIFDHGRCREINKCKDFNGRYNDCEHMCIETKEGGTCTCNSGYILSDDEKSCLDIDECKEDNPCDLSISTCINTQGSFFCDCFTSAGYITSVYDNKMCVNLNECQVDPYICGDLNFCCKDLPPPDKFSCVAPLNLNYEDNNDESDNYKTSDISQSDVLSIGQLFKKKNKFQTGCYESDIEYPKYNIYTLNSILNPEDCQISCQDDAGCDYFTFDVINKICYLKAAKIESNYSPGMISGPKDCKVKRFQINIMANYSPETGENKNSMFGNLLRRPTNQYKISNTHENKCPIGYKFQQDVWKEIKNKKTMSVIQNKFSSSQINSFTPGGVTEGIQSNAMFLADQFNQWYEVFTTVPDAILPSSKDNHLSTITFNDTNLGDKAGFIAGGIPPPPKSNHGYGDYRSFEIPNSYQQYQPYNQIQRYQNNYDPYYNQPNPLQYPVNYNPNTRNQFNYNQPAMTPIQYNNQIQGYQNNQQDNKNNNQINTKSNNMQNLQTHDFKYNGQPDPEKYR